MRVVLVDVRLDLAHQVRSDIRRLRVDAAGDPREERGRGGAEAEAAEQLQRARRVRGHGVQDQEAEGESSETEGDNHEAHHGARREGDLQPAVEAAHGARHRRPHVGVGGHEHAHPASERTEGSASDEGRRHQGPVEGAHSGLDREERAEYCREEHDKSGHLGILLLQKGHCPGLDLRGKFIQPRHTDSVPSRMSEKATPQHSHEEEAEERGRQCRLGNRP
mmetsp:Transcript_20944/g.59202  ORF Transcript_20944/g.59202 Transcript_20944/m.59202 type:complete len:221 (+) Transcript_20944:1688-2350(+)